MAGGEGTFPGERKSEWLGGGRLGIKAHYGRRRGQEGSALKGPAEEKAGRKRREKTEAINGRKIGPAEGRPRGKRKFISGAPRGYQPGEIVPA